MKKIILLFLVFLNILYGNTINNYVDKENIQKVNKIFFYEKVKKNEKNLEGKNSLVGGNSQENGNLKKNENTKIEEKIIEKIEEIELKYRDSKEIVEKLDGLAGYKLIGIENKIIIRGNEKEIDKIINIIKNLDKKKEQVIIKGTIIDTSANLFERLGINLGLNGEKGTNYSEEGKNLILSFLNGEVSISNIFLKGGNFFGIDFNMLKENGDIKIEAMPTLMLMEKEEGILKVTEEVLVGEKKITKNDAEHIEPIFSEAGIVFKILPEVKNIDGEKNILLQIDSEISNFKLTSSYSENSGAKQKNQTKTTITLKDGSSTFIGGLKQNVGKETVRKVPFLADIPIIGPIFKYRKNNKEIRDIYIEIEGVIQK